MKSMEFPCRRRMKLFILYLVGILSGIILYPILIANRFPRKFSVLRRPEFDRNSSIVFVGGHPRSGTTLMRVLLDAHPHFNCGQETHVIPNLLTLRRKYSRGRPLNRLRQAGLDLALINSTIADSILNILKHRGPLSTRLCSKDPFTLKHIPYLSLMFPNAQFVLMVRDARAVLRSIRANKVKISHFPVTEREGLKRWSRTMDIMFSGCLQVGPARCILIHYESLVLEPRFWLEKILRFLGADWNEAVLKHTQFFNVSGGILVSSLEKSSDQVRQPIHQHSLYSWLSSSLSISQKELSSLAPMMKMLGYTEIGQPPKYSRLKYKTFSYKG